MSELDEQLLALVQQYGIEEVQRRLRIIRRPKSARDCVTGMNLPSSQKDRLLALAQSFEEKRFLPTSSDIRNFLEAYGAPPLKIKTRQDATLRVFRFLSSLSDQQLDRIIDDGSFAGPSELGPIADAIRAKGVSMRQQQDATNSFNREENKDHPGKPSG